MGERASDRAYEALRSEILDGVLLPGAVLAEVEQAARLGVSRTPLREALSRLTADGLVGPSGRGLVVTELSTDSIRELYQLRQALEEQAAWLAAARRPSGVFEQLAARFGESAALLDQGDAGTAGYYGLVAEFDEAIDQAVANDYLVAALGSVRTHLMRMRRLARRDWDRLRAAAAEHQLIAEAIAAGDARLAAHATHVHLHRSLTAFLGVLEARGSRHDVA
jgi:DNA-binding GntR family transcriptional regulator